MANLISNESLDMNNLNLFRLTAGYKWYNFYDNINYYYNGTKYSDVVGQQWDYNGQQRVSFFYGDNITISSSGVTGGVVTAYAEGLWNGSNSVASPTFAITGTSISAAALYRAAQTTDVADDYAILGQALSGDDNITGSAYADTLYGFSGNDIINAGLGNDYIGGGRGNDSINGGGGQDTALYVGRYSDYKISYNSLNATFTIIDNGSGYDGTDTVSDVEFFMFGDGKTLTASQIISSLTPIDSTAPILSSFTPADNSSNVAIGANIILNFNESVRAGSGNIVIRNADGSIAKSISATDTSQVFFNGAQVTVNPTTDLLGGKDYYVTIDNGAIKDVAGNNYAGISVASQFNFTTAGDSTAPILSSFTPADNSSNVAIGANIILNFNESVRAGSGNIVIRNADGSIAKSISATDTSQVFFNGAQVTVNPTTDLLGGKDYYVTIDNGAIKDVAGNNYAGISVASQFNFTTAGDSTAPILSSFTPADNSSNVAIGANIILNFNESVRAGSGNIVIRNADGSIAKSISATDTSQVFFNGAQVTVNPTTDLLGGKDYYVTIDNGAIKDVAGNNYAGISNATQFNFSTASTIGSIINGSLNHDQLQGTNKDDTFNGGKGSDWLWGGGGADTFKFSEGDTYTYNHQTEALVFDFGVGQRGVGDVIDYSNPLSVGGSSSAATADQASINQSTGLVQFALGSGTTLADAMHDIAARFTVAGDSKGEFALFQTSNFTGTYLFISDGVSGVTSGDNVIGLCGVSKVSGVDLSAGNLSIFGTSSNT